jgi:hypothetical protein
MHISTMRTVRVLPHVKRLDDCFGDFLVRVTCPCGASRHIEPEARKDVAEVVAVVAGYLMRERHWSRDEAIAFIGGRRDIQLTPGIEGLLRSV